MPYSPRKTKTIIGIISAAPVAFLSILYCAFEMPYIPSQFTVAFSTYFLCPLLVLTYYYFLFLKPVEGYKSAWQRAVTKKKGSRKYLVVFLVFIFLPLFTLLFCRFLFPQTTAIPSYFFADKQLKDTATVIKTYKGSGKSRNVEKIHLLLTSRDHKISFEWENSSQFHASQIVEISGRFWSLGTYIDVISPHDD